MKKIIIACLLSATLSMAQIADPNAYTSGAPDPATTVVNINHVENDEPMFAVSVHPVSMIILSLISVPSVYLTIEGNIGSRMSLITRPSFIWYEFTSGAEHVDLSLWGISEGLRYYFDEGHRGIYLAGHFSYDRIGIDYTYDRDPSENESAHANLFGGGIYVGHKVRNGHFTMSLDIGFVYYSCSATSDEKDDIDEASTVGAGIDLNYTIGVAF